MLNLQNPEIFRAILDSLQTGVYLVDRDRKILFWNDGAEKITGYHRHDVVGRSCRDNILMHCDESGCTLCGVCCPLVEVIHQGKPMEARVYLHHKDGHRVPVHVRAVPIRDENGLVIGVVESFDQESFYALSASAHEDKLAAYGCLDVTTGIPHHHFTRSYLREHLAIFSEFHVPFGVLCAQIDQLQHLTGTHGREATNVMLHVTAQTMKHTLGPSSFLGRWSENQFLAILPDCNRAGLEKISTGLQKIISRSGIQWWDDYLEITISVGMAMAQIGDTVESLVEHAQRGLPSNGPVDDAPLKAETARSES